MILDNGKKILIVGLGLMGGSYARALKKRGFTVRAITRDEESVSYALAEGIIDEGTTDVSPELIGSSDIVIFALYPHVFVEWIEKNGHLLRSGTVITDVTGVKSAIVSRVQDILHDRRKITVDTSLRLAKYFGVSDSYFLNIQNDIDFRNEKEKLKAELDRIPVLRYA